MDETLNEAFLNAPVLFGLEAQGHMPTIKRMLEEKATWESIGNAIGWCPVTAREWYERAVWRGSQETILKSEVLPALAAAVGLLEKLSKDYHHSWDINDIARAIFAGDKHLASKTTRVIGPPSRLVDE